MEKRMINGVEVLSGSGNVFADLGLPDADKLKIKTDLVAEIRKAIRSVQSAPLNKNRNAQRLAPSGNISRRSPL